VSAPSTESAGWRAKDALVSATPQETSSEPIPTGTVTFVFTDIEGSTERWDRERDAMQAAVRRHDEIVRSAIVDRGGYVFKTIGDAFCAAFARPEDAVAAILAAQRAIASEDFSAVGGLRVRAAIHTGTADERGRDYFGPAVNRVARLLGIANGGQVLLSGATADLVQGDLPSQASLRDLGEHRLRDLARPEYVYQLLAPDLAADFPPLRSLDILPNNLPLQLTSFVGREKEVGEITNLIGQHRLVTLVGSGGVGKTRTSLQVGANLLDGSGDGVWFIELAPLTNGEYVPTTIAVAMGITLAEGEPLGMLVNALKAKRALLIFDNCEHLVEAAARAIAALMRACPQIKILASTRQALGIAGEETYRMPSLGVPAAGVSGEFSASEAASIPAIALFVERALSVDKRFELTDENAPIVADICRRLDGIPLAIELAAARVKILSPRQLRDRLDERFRVLTGGNRDVLPRQQTLRALIDWSHDLLDERERTLFRRLGIFVNGFTIEGATAVGSGPDFDELDVFDVLASLVDKSLVLAEPDSDSLRYRLLESTRFYALARLDEAQERPQLSTRHLHYFRDRFGELLAEAIRTGRRTQFVEALKTELEDVRSALDARETQSDDDARGWLLASIGVWWEALGLGAEATSRCESAFARSIVDPRLLSCLCVTLSDLHNSNFQISRAYELAVEAVKYARETDDEQTIFLALRAYARSATFAFKLDEAEAALTEAESHAATSVAFRSSLTDTRAHLYAFRGDFDNEVKSREQDVERQRVLGNERGLVIALSSLAEAEHHRGKTQRSIEIVREVIESRRYGADTLGLAHSYMNLTGYLVAIDDFRGAFAPARDALSLLAATDINHAYVAVTLEHFALTTASFGDLQRAAIIEGFVDPAFARSGFVREFTEIATHDRLMNLLRDAYSPEDFERLLQEGAALTPEAAVALALEDP
jgi:predicted ATPase/class 3 adenylate cyclase